MHRRDMKSSFLSFHGSCLVNREQETAYQVWGLYCCRQEPSGCIYWLQQVGKKLGASIYLPSLSVDMKKEYLNYTREETHWRRFLTENVLPTSRFDTTRVLARTRKKTKHKLHTFRACCHLGPAWHGTYVRKIPQTSDVLHIMFWSGKKSFRKT